MATTKVRRDSSNTNTTDVPGKKKLSSTNLYPRTTSTTNNCTRKSSSIILASKDSITSKKQAANYLKPTKSSPPTTIKHLKNENHYTNKPILKTRRSFDKLPSSSESSSLAHEKAPERVFSKFSSFSSKTTSSPLPRISSSSMTTGPARVTKLHILYANNEKKSTETFVRKEEVKSKGTCTTNKIGQPYRTVVNMGDDYGDQGLIKAIPLEDDHDMIISEVYDSHDDYGSNFNDDEHDKDIDHNICTLSPPCGISTMSEEPVVKADDPDTGNNNNDGVDERSTTEIHNKLDRVDKEEEDINQTDDHDSDQLLLKNIQDNMNQNKLADHRETNITTGDDQQDSKANDKIYVKDEGINNVNEEATIATNRPNGTANEENKITNLDDNNDHHKEEKQVVDENAKPIRKKESQPYNNIIEETASKLLTKRKNKVKALVDAFQIVIDNESK